MCKSYHPQSCDTPAPFTSGYTRRRFLNHGLAMVSAAATVPAFLSNAGNVLAADTTMRLSSKPGTPDGRVLVVVQLSGGNDGLNTVIPIGDPAYRKSRPILAVNESDALAIPGYDGMALHPALAPIHEMMGAGLAGVVQGVGYPNPNRSHFASMDIWHTAETASQRGRGWIGKAMDLNVGEGGMDCVAIGNDAPLATLGKQSRPVSFQDANLFRWGGRDLHSAVDQAYDQLDTPVAGDDPLAFINRTQMDAQVASDRIRKAVASGSDQKWPNNPLAKQLQAVAKMIRADLPTRVYYVALGGFDTHAQQANNHQRLLSQFAESMQAFYAQLEANGDGDRVVSLAFSEFGRRVRQNASGGTDHGCAGPSFVFGKSVKSGLLGKHPSLTELDKGDLIFKTDFRSVYSDLLNDWMKIDAQQVLGARYPSAGLFA